MRPARRPTFDTDTSKLTESDTMTIRKRPERGTWQATVKNPITGRRQAKDFARKVDAERWIREQITAAQTGRAVAPGKGKATIAELAAKWETTRGHLKVSSRSAEATKLRVHVLPALGHVKVADLRRSDVQAWISSLSAIKAGSTVRQAYYALTSVLDLAVDDGQVAANPAAGVKLPRAAKVAKRFLDAGDVAALANAASGLGGPRDRTMVLTLAYTGLRFGELVALHVGDLDLLRRQITVSRSITETDGVLVESSTKSHQIRTISLPAFLADLLAVQVVDKARGELVFTDSDGGPVRISNWRRRVFYPAVEASLDGTLTIHGLRAAFVGLAAGTGATVKDIQTALGHSSAAMTLDRYAPAFPAAGDRMAAALDAVAATPAAARGTVIPIRTA